MMEENQYYKQTIDIKEFFFKYMLRFLIASVISISIFLIIIFVQKDDEGLITYLGISNGLLIGGVSSLVLGLFSFITNLGFFDFISYNGSRLRSLMQKYEGVNYHGVYEYTEAKKEKRKKNRFVCIPYLIVGIVLIIAAIIYTYTAGQNYA